MEQEPKACAAVKGTQIMVWFSSPSKIWILRSSLPKSGGFSLPEYTKDTSLELMRTTCRDSDLNITIESIAC